MLSALNGTLAKSAFPSLEGKATNGLFGSRKSLIFADTPEIIFPSTVTSGFVPIV